MVHVTKQLERVISNWELFWQLSIGTKHATQLGTVKAVALQGPLFPLSQDEICRSLTVPSVLEVPQFSAQTNALDIPVAFGADAWPLSPQSTADELCAQLVDHVLDCDICLSIVPDLTCSTGECGKHCAEYRRIQQEIARAGGPGAGQVIAF